MVQVRVSEGVLEGETVKNDLGGQFYSFKGIPFAQPPLGDLRYKAPQTPKPWDGVRSAKEHGSLSMQCDVFLTDSEKIGSEDCLYLNVYSPDVKPVKPLPVMVWIHGGAFIIGTGNDEMYGPEFLIRHGVVLVTFNYRLGALGFLCLDTSEVPGNAGMKDQVAALRWVKKNIINFGGDPNNVTLFGESAGGGSTSLHLFSPMSKGLFRRAIVQSGAATNCWAISFEPRYRAIAIAKKLGCDSEDNKELYEFFKSAPPEKLIGFEAPMTFAERGSRVLLQMHCTIVQEKQFAENERFFYEGLISRGAHEGVEVITGYTADEGIIGLHNEAVLQQLLDVIDFPESFVPKHLALNCPMKDQFEVGKLMRDFYCKGEKVSAENILPLVKYMGMELFTYEIIQLLKHVSKRNKSYLYKLTFRSERNVMAHLLPFSTIFKGKSFVCHGDDLLYIFPMKMAGLKVDQKSESFKIINYMTEMWTNFAKYGDPTPNDKLGIKWLPFSSNKQNYLDIGEKLVQRVNPDEEEIKFWESIYKKCGFDAIFSLNL